MANEDTAEVQQPKSKKGLIIIIVVVVNVLLIGGVIFFMLGNKGEGTDGADGQKPRQQRAARSVTDGPIEELDGFVVNLANARDKKYLKTKMSVQLFSPEDQVEFDKNLSIVRNEILLQLSAIEMEKVQTIEGKRDLEKLLVQKVNGRLDMDRVANIYLTEFVTQ